MYAENYDFERIIYIYVVFYCCTAFCVTRLCDSIIIEQRTAQSRQAGDQYTEVHNQNLGTGIQQTGTSRTPNEVSFSMSAIRFDVAVHGDNLRK